MTVEEPVRTGATFQEKAIWIYLAVAIAVPAVYFAIIAGRLADSTPERVDFTWILVGAVLTGVVVTVIANIALGILSPQERSTRDERERSIWNRGERIGFSVMSILAVVPFVLALGRVDQFWIANALYLSFVTAAIVSSVVRLVSYRRGF